MIDNKLLCEVLRRKINDLAGTAEELIQERDNPEGAERVHAEAEAYEKVIAMLEHENGLRGIQSFLYD